MKNQTIDINCNCKSPPKGGLIEQKRQGQMYNAMIKERPKVAEDSEEAEKVEKAAEDRRADKKSLPKENIPIRTKINDLNERKRSIKGNIDIENEKLKILEQELEKLNEEFEKLN